MLLDTDIGGTATIYYDSDRIQKHSTAHAAIGCDVASPHREICVVGGRDDDMFG